MENLKEFKKFFNNSFWKAFRGKGSIIDIPNSRADKMKLITDIYHELKDWRYFPSPPKLFLATEKKNGIPRFNPVFTIKDYCLYYYCIKKIEAKIAFNRVPHTFGGWTLGGLMRRSEEDEMINLNSGLQRIAQYSYVGPYSFNVFAWSKAYGDLNSKLYVFCQNEEYNHVMMLDIANFYDRIRLDSLEQKIREVTDGSDSEALNILFLFLNYWNRGRNGYNRQTVGLPQDAMGDFSRILANFYLQEYDDFMYNLCTELGCQYLRYADDQFIFLRDIELAKKIEYKAAKYLDHLGLSINQLKVNIMRTEDLIEYRSFRIFDILTNDNDRKDRNKVESFADHYINLLDNNGLANIKDNGMPLLNRLLFCPALKSIEFTKKTKIMSSLLDENYLKKANSEKFYRIYSLLSNDDRTEFIARLKNIALSNIYNLFHYQLLDFFQRIGESTESIREQIKNLELD